MGGPLFAQESSSRSQGLPPEPGEPAAQAQAPEPVSEPVTAAEAAIASADWKTAETRLDPWLAAHPNDARALFDAGYVADQQNRQDDAARLYQRAVTANPRSFEAQLMLGMLLARQGKQTEARPALAAATQLDPGEAGPVLKARAWRALARIDASADPVQASNDLIQALKLTPETEDDTLLAASLAEKAGQADTAETAYRRVLAKDPQSVPANAGLAHLLIAKKQYADAEALLRTALASAPDDPGLTAQLATALAAQDKAEALPLLQKLHETHPDNADITEMLADVLSQAGDFAGSDALDVKLLAARPNDAGLLVAHGQNLVRLMRFAEAFAAFDKATQIDPGNTDGWSGLAFASSRLGRHDVTLHALTMRSRYLPENASTYFLWATTYDALRQKQQAIVYYHHFLDASAGKFPDQEWQARQRLHLLEK